MEIPFELLNGLIIINAEVNEVNGSFILDTGSDALLLNEKQSNHSKHSFSTVHGDISVGSKEVQTLKIGRIEHNNVKAYLTNLSSLENFTQTSLKGIIGGKFFVPNKIHIDYQSNLITISSEQTNMSLLEFPHQMKFEVFNDVPCVQIKIGKHKHWFALDSGATSHFIDEKSLNELNQHFSKTGLSVNVLNAGNKSANNYRYRLDVLNLGDRRIQESLFVPQDLSSINSEMEIQLTGILSLSALDTKEILIDLEHKLLRF